MIPMGVKNNDTKYEPKTQRWRPGIGVSSGGSPRQNLRFRAKNSLFLPKIALEPVENGETKGNGAYTPHAT